MKLILQVIYYYNYFVLWYFIIICTIYLFLNLLSFRVIREYAKRVKQVELTDVFRLHHHKPISVIVPAYNERNTIIDSAQALLQLEYPEFQVVVVNDGSKDDTLERLIRHFGMKKVPFVSIENLPTEKIRGMYRSNEYPSLLVIDKENGGKADAINAGVNSSKFPLICVIDADSILERDCLLKIARPFVEDENVVAVGGIIRIVNGCDVKQGRIMEIGVPDTWLGRFQVVEYLRAFLFGRTGFDVLNGLIIISGAFSCFTRDALLMVGGYRTDAIGEDMELVVRMHRLIRKKNRRAKITFVPDPVCWTEAPESFEVLKSQRIRWQKGTIQSLGFHKSLFLNPKYGWVGMLVYPYYVFFEAMGPFIEITGYVVFAVSWYLNIINLPFAIAFLTVAILFGIALSMLSVILEELSFRKYPKTSHLLVLFAASVFENFGFRQMLSWWRFKGTLEWIFGKRAWGHMEKRGFWKR